MKLWINVCYHHVEERFENFKQLLENLKSLKTDKTKIIINTNTEIDCDLPINISLLQDPYHLTWEHKKYMQSFLDSDFTHFMYLEGNLLYTQKNLDYWIRNREIFERNGLNFIPAIHRVRLAEGKTWSLDPTKKQSIAQQYEIEGKRYISMQEPYQGMFLMNRQDVAEHMQTDYYHIGQKGWWGIRESANLGNMFVNVPQNFGHRMLLCLNEFPDSWIPHFGTDYQADPQSPHAKVTVEEVFINGN